jgi:GLPGLI family protein
MKSFLTRLSILVYIVLMSSNGNAQDFQGKAYYESKTTMDMSRFTGGRQMSEQQKKQMKDRMKQWLERTYVLTFTKEESVYKEDEVLEGPGGRGSNMWGSSFSPGPQYKNIKTKTFIQDQEFFGKKFLITEEMQPIEWIMGTETKQIGKYTCFKATATRPSTEIDWGRRMRRGNRSDTEKSKDSTKTDASGAGDKLDEADNDEPQMIEIVAWYTPMIPISQGPADFWGLPGLILEVSAGNVTMLCSKIVMNPEEKTKIDVPTKGDVVTKKEYNEIITEKMQQMRDSRGRNSGRR